MSRVPRFSRRGDSEVHRSSPVQRCPSCSQCFSGDARFCPFDGEPLQVAEGDRLESDPLTGEIIDGRYEVEAVLGQGGMGKVYGVLHRALANASPSR